MLILTIRTDKPEAEVGLYEDTIVLENFLWQAHRQLAETLHATIRDLFLRNNRQLQDVDGIVCFQGPGSFTGLRIGLTVANTLAYSFAVPIVAVQGEDFAPVGVRRLIQAENDKLAIPFYGADVHITAQKK